MNSKPAKQKILIVDDISENIDVLIGILSRDYKIAAARSGENALKLANSKNPPDLILLDIMMPEMDGYEVCRRLKSGESTKEIPVIFISAKNEVEDETRGFELGAVDYITKPINAEIVRTRAKTHLELKFSRDLIKRHNEQLETMLEQRTKELVRSERQAAFGQLVQGIVHNMRSPLSVISMNFQLLGMFLDKIKKLAGPFPENTVEELNKIFNMAMQSSSQGEKSVNRLESMLHSMMLRGSRDKSDMVEIFDLNHIIRQEVEFMAADFIFKNKTKKTIELDEKEITVEAVPADVAQVIQNLVQNALDAMHHNDEKNLKIKSGVKDGNGIFQIADNGPGIPVEIQEKIFDPFFTTKSKGDDEQKGDKPSGTGLGLWMCKEALESCGGNIIVKSQAGTGTEFTVILPLKR